MPYPDNFDDKAFEAHWGDEPVWVAVLKAEEDALLSLINRAFAQNPGEVGAKARYALISNAIRSLRETLDRYLPFIGNSRRHKIMASYVRMMEMNVESNLTAVLENAVEYVGFLRAALEAGEEDHG